MAGTDILIGMHGAALTYAFLLSPHAALVELWPQVRLVAACWRGWRQQQLKQQHRSTCSSTCPRSELAYYRYPTL